MPTEFDTLLPSEYWKFFTDVSAWERNKTSPHLVFDMEESPGYFRSCSTALWWMLQTLNDPVDLDYIITLRNLAYHKEAKPTRGLALNSVSSGIGLQSFTEKGLEQLQNETIKADTPAFHLAINDESYNHNYNYLLWNNNFPISLENIIDDLKNNKTVGLCRNSSDVKSQKYAFGEEYTPCISDQPLEKTERTIASFLEQYQQDITQATSSDQKLLAIVKFIQSLHQFHLFPDGNGRTFCFFLLNRLLHDNELPLTTIQNPGWFTGWSREELVEEVKKGQLRFKTISHPITLPLNHKIEKEITLTPQEKELLWINSEKRNKYKDAFINAIKNENRDEQLHILETLPYYERVYLVHKLCENNTLTTEQKTIAEDHLQRLRFLLHTGFENDESIYSEAMKATSFESPKILLETLYMYNLSNEPAWRRVVSDMIQKNRPNAKEALEAGLNQALLLKDQPWFDLEKYTHMLLASPEYSIFPPLGLKNISLSENSIALMKDFIYQSPELAKKILTIAEDLSRETRGMARAIIIPKNDIVIPYQIYLFINEKNRIQYKIKDESEKITIVDIEDDLIRNIGEENLNKIKHIIQEEKNMLPENITNRRAKKPPSIREKIERIESDFFDIIQKLAEEKTPDERLSKMETEARLRCDNLLTHPQAFPKYEYVLSQMRGSFFTKQNCANITHQPTLHK